MKVFYLSSVVAAFILVLSQPVIANDVAINALAAQIKDATQSQRVIITQSVGKIDSRLIDTGKYSINIQREIQRHIAGAARYYKLPKTLFKAIIKVESNFDPTALSHKKCYGLTQLAPGTARDIGADIYDLRQNIYGGASYFRKMYDRYGSVEEALWAYNAGPGRVNDNILPRETKKYIKDVMRFWQEYEQAL